VSTAKKVVREQLARERRRRRALWATVVAVVVLVAAGVTGWAVWSGQRPAGHGTPAGATADGTGIVSGTGPVTVDVYEDFLCPVCRRFEQLSAGTLEQLRAAGRIKVVHHPVAFLNRFSSTDYSTRSSAASGCAADQGKFQEYATALFNRQPAEGGPGLSDDQLVAIGADVGLGGDFGRCVREGTYRSWTARVTDAASRAGVTGTPTVLVDGTPVPTPTPEAITAAVQAASR
jgi:protein-disulfide isomerase